MKKREEIVVVSRDVKFFEENFDHSDENIEQGDATRVFPDVDQEDVPHLKFQ